MIRIERSSKESSSAPSARPFDRSDILLPSEIHQLIEREIIGQDDAKRALSVALYNHIKRLHYTGPVQIEKSNILLIGPSGCGKTLLARTLARILGVPCVAGSATSLTEAGYVGDDVESLLVRLLQKADDDVELAQRGVLFIDEIDKLIGRNPMEGVSTTGVQADLLKLLEGVEVELVSGRGAKSDRGETVTMDTSQILFICAGAFTGLSDIVQRRRQSALPVGHSVPRSGSRLKRTPSGRARRGDDRGRYGSGDDLRMTAPSDLIEFGLLSELVGRLPVIVPLAALSRIELKRVLVEPASGLVRQYQELMRMDGIDLIFEESALDGIAHAAFKEGGGARSLRRVMEEVMLDLMFDLPSCPPSEPFQVTASRVEETLDGKVAVRARKRGRRMGMSVLGGGEPPPESEEAH